MKGVLCCFGTKKSNPPPPLRTDTAGTAPTDATQPTIIAPRTASKPNIWGTSSGASSSTIISVSAGNARKFKFSELMNATGGFSKENFLGKGGFGGVYIGNLEGEVVAIKRRKEKSSQGTDNLKAELEALAGVEHPHIIRLVGYCAEQEELLLVYEYISMGSLEEKLHGGLTKEEKKLTWNIRLKIAVGAARGLQFLHCNRKMIHCDMKSGNILLGNEYTAKISDFGTAREVSAKGGPPPIFSFGYVDPVFTKTTQAALTVDIYAFGVILLELFTGQKASDRDRPDKQILLAEWARLTCGNGKDDMFLMMADPIILQDKYPKEELQIFFSLAMRCIDKLPENRPIIEDIVSSLDQLERQANDFASSKSAPQVQSGSQGGATP